jgi:predicted acetyltransferase
MRLEDEAEILRAQEELSADDFEFVFLREGVSFADLVARTAQERAGDVPEGRVPATFLVAEHDGAIVGRVSIRHALNDFLLREGGHIGYAVRPAWRRRGFATSILRQSLALTDELGIARVLVTCDDDNVGSAAVIESQGGVLEDVVPVEGGTPKRRYWIDRTERVAAATGIL